MVNHFTKSLFACVIFSLKTIIAFGQSDGFEIITPAAAYEQELMERVLWGAHSPVPFDRLKIVQVKYKDFEGTTLSGKIMVLDACAPQVLRIFETLYAQDFRIAEISLIDKYDGSDSLSMAHNNTSAHNLRAITGGTRFSLHAYGTAIDLNPVQNPYLAIPCDEVTEYIRFEPAAGIAYANRRENRPGKANREGMAETALAVFAKNGFYQWGGYWNCPIDYQHFQIDRALTELLVALPVELATEHFQLFCAYYNHTQQPIVPFLASKAEGLSLVDFYLQQPTAYAETLREIQQIVSINE